MPKAGSLPTTPTPPAAILPAIPPPRVSAYELAAALPELWSAKGVADQAALRFGKNTFGYHEAHRQMEDLAWRIEAVEGAVLGAPAQNLADVAAQLILLLRLIGDRYHLDDEARTLASALRVILRACSADLAGLIENYAKFDGLEAA